MLRVFLLLVLCSFVLSACDIDESMRAKSKNQASANVMAIASKNGCMGCHAVNITVVGPAWILVAKKYADETEARAFLIEKIKKGGEGNWNVLTGGVEMPSYEYMPDDEIAQIVDYILTLN